ncbi:MAG: DNA primase [Chloroflexi bacterium]|nr:DNA primase [Chloroflexota bacterium]
MGVIDEVKERLDIVDIISSYVPLTKAGRNYKALCPFHSEKTPSFVVFPDTQTWHCFGACATGGDLFGFVMRRENLEFAEALRLLAERAGVALEPRHAGEEAEGKLKDRLRRINALAAEYFHYLLLNAPEGAGAREYLAHRGISEATWTLFHLGFARDDWQALGNHLSSKGYSSADLLEAGLVIERQGGGYYDRFRGRLMFPIRDISGHVIGFGARALDDSLPKYLNSPQTSVFDKSSVLYGIEQAKAAIREQGLAVIVEGYMDVLMAHQCGRKNVIASMGTALTEKQVRVIKRLTKKLILALDADVAGDQATLRGLQVAKETFDHHAVPVLTWRGLVRYEDQLDGEIRILTLPSGQDPDEVIRADVAQWDALVAQALEVVEYYLRTVLARFNLEAPKDKVAAAKEVLPLIQEITSAVERSHYLQELARRLRVDERVLLQEMEGKSSSPRQALRAEERIGRLSALQPLSLSLESYVLVLLLRRPDLLAAMNDTLVRVDLEPLTSNDFAGAEERALFEAISQYIAEHGEIHADTLRQRLSPPLQAAFDRLLGLMEEARFLSDEQLQLDSASRALSLRELCLRRQSEKLRYLQEDAHAAGDAQALRRWAEMVSSVTMQLVRVQRHKAAQTSLRGSISETSQV